MYKILQESNRKEFRMSIRDQKQKELHVPELKVPHV